jgi:3-phenylpropionate/trans-cinnamate dioxygenase ferredoxin subunit
MTESAPTEWREVARLSDFADADRKLVDLGGDLQIGLFKCNGDFFAISAWCSHQKASLLAGEVSGGQVACPMHGARFDLATGRHLSFPAVKPVVSYPVKVENDAIYLKT